MEYTAIILAGGKSSRFGRDKTVLKVNDEFIIEGIVKKCKAIFSEILIVSNHQNKFGIPDTKEISDIYKGQGPLGGIHAGLRAAAGEVCFAVACDMPFFYLPLVGQLLEESEGYDVVVPREGNHHLQPLFAVYKKNILPQVEKLLSENKNSIMRLYDLVKVRYIDEHDWQKSLHGSEDIFYNINYMNDYKRLRYIHGLEEAEYEQKNCDCAGGQRAGGHSDRTDASG